MCDNNKNNLNSIKKDRSQLKVLVTTLLEGKK